MPVASPAENLKPTHTALPPWVPDAGDGTYRNPILFADYSDPDAIRVGNDYWLTSSSFGHVPGLPILHSRDLVNWALVNHALPQLVPVDHFRTPRHGGGVWAPSLRYHEGKFYLYYPDPDFGLYVVTTDDPRGTWSAPTLVLGGRGLIDPCPLWDENGHTYLVHGWAKSRAGICNRVTLHRLNAEGTAALDEGKVVIDADLLPGWKTLEGPKLYRRGQHYFIFAPAGGVATGYQAVFRADKIEGPYEPRIVLEQGRTPINGPHQGAWVDTPTGEHWFLHFQDCGPFGRVVHLEPMHWGTDNWPTMGHPGANGVGEPVLTHAKPRAPKVAPTGPFTTDEFIGPELGRQWQWQGNPTPGWASIAMGTLRLQALPLPSTQNLWLAPNLLLQKFPAPQFTATTTLSLPDMSVGATAGLIVFGYSYAWIGLRRTASGLQLVQAACAAANEGTTEAELACLPASGSEVRLQVSVDTNARCTFAYAFASASFVAVGQPFHATVSKWVGAKVGLFARVDEAAAKSALAEFGGFRIGTA